MQALQRQIIGVIAGFADAARPPDERRFQGVPNLLRLFLE